MNKIWSIKRRQVSLIKDLFLFFFWNNSDKRLTAWILERGIPSSINPLSPWEYPSSNLFDNSRNSISSGSIAPPLTAFAIYFQKMKNGKYTKINIKWVCYCISSNKGWFHFKFFSFLGKFYKCICRFIKALI